MKMMIFRIWFVFKIVYVSEFRTIIINNYRDDNSANYDRVTVGTQKTISELIVTPLIYIYIYILSIQNRIFPDNFKDAIFKTILNGDEGKFVNNYWLTSMLTNFCEIFEKIIMVIDWLS